MNPWDYMNPASLHNVVIITLIVGFLIQVQLLTYYTIIFRWFCYIFLAVFMRKFSYFNLPLLFVPILFLALLYLSFSSGSYFLFIIIFFIYVFFKYLLFTLKLFSFFFPVLFCQWFFGFVYCWAAKVTSGNCCRFLVFW